MKKEGMIIFFVILFSSAVIAQGSRNLTDPVEKAYACLYDKVKDKCASLTVEQQSFSLLALAHTDVVNECKDALVSKSRRGEGECWPKEGCKLRETSLATLSLGVTDQSTDKPLNWLISANSTPRDLIWYLEIDSQEATACTISYSGKDFKVSISAEKQFSNDAEPCLKRAVNNYFLEVDQSCLTKTFTVSCDKEFISTFLYKKKDSDVFHVSSKTESASAGGKTQNTIRAICFKEGAECNYEGSLWTTLALIRSGKETALFIPYLTAFSSDNKKFFPQSFLFMLTDRDEFFSEINSLRDIDGFWDLNSQYGRFYDTSLGILALKGEGIDDTREWLLSNQDSSGCWNNGNIRDTAFILYSMWPRYFDPSTGRINVTIGNIPYCEKSGFYCISAGECDTASGKNLENYFCPGFNTICCDTPAQREESCFDKGGIICRSDEKCTPRESIAQSSDPGICCRGDCIKEEPSPTPQKTECEKEGFECLSDCPSFKEEKDFSCASGKVCCGEKTSEEPPAQGGSKLWLILLLGSLIILVIIGILFRNQIRLFLFKRKKGPEKQPFRFGPPLPPRPPFPPRTPPQAQRTQFPQRPIPKRESLSDKEFDETLKKLKEIEKK